jgi:hypothetical protein
MSVKAGMPARSEDEDQKKDQGDSGSGVGDYIASGIAALALGGATAPHAPAGPAAAATETAAAGAEAPTTGSAGVTAAGAEASEAPAEATEGVVEGVGTVIGGILEGL